MEISIIITNFNYEKYLARSVRSVLNQSFNKSEYEIVVIDDCSSDNSKNIIDSFSSHVRPMFNDKNLGLSKSCNKAIKTIMSKMVYFVDADDFINKDALLICHSFLSSNKDTMDAVSSDYFEINEKEAILKRRDGMAFPIRCGTLYYTDHLLELGPYQEVVREDIDFRKRFLQSGKYIYNVCLPLYRYTQHNESLTKT